MRVFALGPCRPECVFCQREWFKWYRGRMVQMNRAKRGESVSFSEAAATSIRSDL